MYFFVCLLLFFLQISATCTHPNAPYAPAIDKPDQALQWIDEAATAAGFQCGKDVGVLIDVAAERLYDVVSKA